MKTQLSFLMILFCTFYFSQNEFITLWKPNNPSKSNLIPNSTSTQIYFPGFGVNYTIYWEEVGNPTHNQTITNITSANNHLINFGNGATAEPIYLLKVSNGNGAFLGLSGHGDDLKILEVRQWGNISWTTMQTAFASCKNMDVTATDIPDLSKVTDIYAMFYECEKLIGNSYFSLWDTSNIKDMGLLFDGATNFNQNIGNWNTSNVTNMSGVFAGATLFNQNIGSWDTSNVTDISEMFAATDDFNQDIGNWNTSKVTNMRGVFWGAKSFNKDIGDWNTSKVQDMSYLFEETPFNQNLGNWNLESISNMKNIFFKSNLSCQNYDKTLIGWANNLMTPNNIEFTGNDNIKYSSAAAVAARNYLINTKGWIITSDIYDSNCSLSTNELFSKDRIRIYPIPSKDFITISGTNNQKYSYQIFDVSGKLFHKGILNIKEKIDIQKLEKGNYILDLSLENGQKKSIKFIKD